MASQPRAAHTETEDGPAPSVSARYELAKARAIALGRSTVDDQILDLLADTFSPGDRLAITTYRATETAADLSACMAVLGGRTDASDWAMDLFAELGSWGFIGGVPTVVACPWVAKLAKPGRVLRGPCGTPGHGGMVVLVDPTDVLGPVPPTGAREMCARCFGELLDEVDS
jgi:hypothetical protein